MPRCIIGNIKIYVEVPILLISFAFALSGSIKTNLVIYRTCYTILGFNKSECALLGTSNVDNTTQALEKEVEPYATVITMVVSLTESLCSVIICFFLCPWSDRFGRKPILILPVIGYLLSAICMGIFTILENLSAWYILISSIPICITGGFSSYLTVVLSYLTDITNESNRGMRMAVFEAVLAIGIFLGNISNSFVFAATSYFVIFLISSVCFVLILVFTIFFIPESLENPQSEGRLKGLIETDNIKDMVKATFKRRANYERFTILGCVLMLSIFILLVNGEGGLTFMYLRAKFSWSLEQYNIYSAAHNVTWILGTVIGAYLLHKVFKISEDVMIIIGFVSSFLGMLFMGFAKVSWQVYAASFSRCLGGVLSPMVRSLVSKIVSREDVGKIFAFIVASESVFGLGGSPMFTTIYNSTISTNPAIYNFVGAAIYLIEIVIAILVLYARRLNIVNIQYEEVVHETNEERNDI